MIGVFSDKGQLKFHSTLNLFLQPTDSEWRKLHGVSRKMGGKGITSCLFRNITKLTGSIMKNPNRNECFVHSKWTIVLMGSSSWAAHTVRTAVEIGLYDKVSKN